MTTTTDMYWEANGVVLNTLAWNIKTKGGTRFSGPPRRGENQKIPFLEGRQYVPKLRDSRIITLEMWVRGSDEDGTYPLDPTPAELFDANWSYLCDTFQQDDQYPLVKRFRDAGGGLTTVTGMVEWVGGMEPEMHGGSLGHFSVDLLMADPWFYSGLTPVRAIDGEINILGNAPTTKVMIRTSDIMQIGSREIGFTGKGKATIDAVHRQVVTKRGFENDKLHRDYRDRHWISLKPGVHKVRGKGDIFYQAAWR
jgi:hypothetical protein